MTLAKPIKLELRGVIGFSDVILRIIRSYDLRLFEAMISERRITKLIYRSGLPTRRLLFNFLNLTPEPAQGGVS